MCDTNLLQVALGLTPPWSVAGSDFDPEAHRLDIQIDFTPGSRFACPLCGAPQAVSDVCIDVSRSRRRVP